MVDKRDLLLALIGNGSDDVLLKRRLESLHFEALERHNSVDQDRIADLRCLLNKKKGVL